MRRTLPSVAAAAAQVLASPLIAIALLAAPAPALAQSGDNVLLVVNESSPDSIRIAEHYARARGVPQTQLLRIKVDAAADEIDGPSYASQIESPISEWIRKNSAQDRILYIVLTKGIPLRIKGTSGRAGTTASVDSELSLLYRRLTGAQAPLSGPLANPYFLGHRTDRAGEAVQPPVVRHLPRHAPRRLHRGRCAEADRPGRSARARRQNPAGPEERPRRHSRRHVAQGHRRLDGLARLRRPRRPRDDEQGADRREERPGLLLVGIERLGHHAADVRPRLRARRDCRHVRQLRRRGPSRSRRPHGPPGRGPTRRSSGPTRRSRSPAT